MLARLIRSGVVLVLTLHMGLALTGRAAALSPDVLQVDKAGKLIYVVCRDSHAVLVFDLEKESVVKQLAVKEPHALVLAFDESRLYVSSGESQGYIHEIELATGREVRTWEAGHTPESLAVAPDGSTLYYCNRFSRTDQMDVHALDLAAGKVKGSARAVREPATLTLANAGKTLWVANCLPLMPGNSEHVFAVLSLFNAVTMEPLATLDFPSGTFAVSGAALSADEKYIFFTHSVGRFTVPTTHLDRGWINTSAVSIFDVKERKYLNTVLLDDTVQGAANPWGIAVSGDNKWLCVNASGTHELIVIDLPAMMERLANAKEPHEVINDLAFLYGVKHRVKLEGMGPRSIAIAGEQVYSSLYFSDALSVVELWDDGPGGAFSLGLRTGENKPDQVRQGEIRFFDATLCYQNWLSCASCHPGTRSDGTNWDLMNDGIGNPKQSRSLLYTHRTSPVMITGIRASAEIAVSRGFELIQFHALPQTELDTVNAYLKSLEPVQSPYLEKDGTLTSTALRGKVVFEGKAGCVQCHTPPYYGDKKLYKLGLGSDEERNREFATPILIELWRTAPYMYDGRAVTLKEVVTTDNIDNKHGNTKELTEQEVDDLVWYLNSL